MIDLSPRDQGQTEADDVYQSSIRYLEMLFIDISFRDHAEACSAERRKCSQVFTKICIAGKGNFGKGWRAPVLLNMPLDPQIL